MTTDKERTDFGRRLAAVMDRQHVSDKALAAAIGVPTAYIERWRTAQGMPTRSTIARMARALSVTILTLRPE
jgi:transcriptional regulator with XRE-family HTH domain